MPNVPTPLEETLHTFMSTTARSKVAVIIPLFGYWEDSETGQLNEETLKATLDRVFSNVHQLYMVFVAEEKRLSPLVGSVLMGASKAGNFKGVAAKKGQSYGEYLRSGIDCALNETDAQYVVCINPWVMLQYNGLDILVDRINRDDANVVSGYDVKGLITGEAFRDHKFQIPREYRGLDINFFGMKRYSAEIINFDNSYRTHYFIGRDAWQTLSSKNLESIISERVPTYSFDIDWTEFEGRGDFELDKQYFEKKWHYGLEDVKYE